MKQVNGCGFSGIQLQGNVPGMMMNLKDVVQLSSSHVLTSSINPSILLSVSWIRLS